jgi:hypothetical protein
MTLDALFLSRLQWAWVIGWHILLPAFTVGLASYIAVLDEDLLSILRDGCGVGDRHAASVRHQLVALFRYRRQIISVTCKSLI